MISKIDFIHKRRIKMDKIKINKRAEGFMNLVKRSFEIAGITMEEAVDDLFLNTKFKHWSKDELRRIYEAIKSFEGYSAEKLMVALFTDNKKTKYDAIITQLYLLIKIIRPDLFEDY